MISDTRMLRLIDLLRFEGKIKNDADFCNIIDIKPQKLSKVKKGNQQFTAEQIYNVCKNFNVNANWIFGTQDNVYNEMNSIEIRDI